MKTAAWRRAMFWLLSGSAIAGMSATGALADCGSLVERWNRLQQENVTATARLRELARGDVVAASAELCRIGRRQVEVTDGLIRLQSGLARCPNVEGVVPMASLQSARRNLVEGAELACGVAASGGNAAPADCGIGLGPPVPTRCVGSDEHCVCLNVHNNCPWPMDVSYRVSGIRMKLQFTVYPNRTDKSTACTTTNASQSIQYVGARRAP